MNPFALVVAAAFSAIALGYGAEASLALLAVAAGLTQLFFGGGR